MKLPVFADNPLHTRADVQRLLRDLIEPLVPHFSPGCAQVRLGENRGLFAEGPGLLEGFARPLWGIVPLLAGGGASEHAALWQRGIAAGVDPSHPEYWGPPGNYDQRSVEQAAFGFSLALAPEHFWESLDKVTRERLAAWLRGIDAVQLVQSNWLFFRILVHLGLRRCGLDAPDDEADLALIESFHLGGGWYSDGAGGAHHRDGRTGDYYVPMAFQYYALVYAKLAGHADPQRAARFIERAQLFARDFLHYFDAHGAALPFGRSLTYRFAQGAFWGALAFADVEALPWGVIKGLYLRHLRWWMQQPMFSETGLLTIGYSYPNLLMAESYNSSQSPYWALKMFLPLALPEAHPFWTAGEAPLPPRQNVRTVPGAKLILVSHPRTQDVTAINPGQPTLDWPRNAPHKYSKCACSTRFGFSVPASVLTPSEGGLDNGLSLSDDARFYRPREFAIDAEVRDGVAFSRWQPWPDVEVTTWLLAEPAGHVRIHRIQSARQLWTLEAGFAVPWTVRASLQIERDETLVVRAPHGASAMRNLLGEREGEAIDLGANSHLLSSLSTMPALRSICAPGERWLACWVGGAESDAGFPEAAAFAVMIEDGNCRVLCHGEPWWSLEGGACGTSSCARLAALDQVGG